ncbi:MAG TPA: hypothetical protein VKY27_04000 [Bacteriovoracaceae bacterium]|nr:hypothetical protein [Bacteriovoracaceae bacterium]
MKEKFKAHFKSWNCRYFVIFTIISLIITDIINGYYLKLFWSNKGMSQNLVRQSIAQGGMIIEDFSIDTINEMTGFVDNTFYFFLFLILVNNLFFYLFYYLKKLWAQGFILFYTLTAAIFALTFIFDDAGLSPAWKVYNVLSIPFYLYLFLGVKVLKSETTIPAGEKKGR